MQIKNNSLYLKIGTVLVALILLNIISRDRFIRLDLTDNKMYSLSSSSKEVVSQVDDLLTMKVYFSSDLPNELGNTKRFLQDILEEFRAYSNGNIRFFFEDPQSDENLEEQARKDGIQPVQMQVIENDKVEIKKVYLGLVMLYENKKDNIPVIQNTAGLEYLITTKIKSLIVLANTIIKVHNLDCAIEIETSFNQVDISPIEKEHHILRLTVACMSSTLSGSKRFKLGSKDAIFDGDYWNKIACNIPIILKEESYLFSDIDATKGCYIINQLEKKLADSSWSKFKMIESNGGFRSTNNKKQFNEIVEENCKKRLHALKENKKMIIGFNAFSTAEDQIQFNNEMKTPLYLQDLIS